MSFRGSYTTAGQGSTAPQSGTTGARAARRTRKRIATLRLVREGSFAAPSGYPDAGTQVRSPRDVFQLMQPFADREVGRASGSWRSTASTG